MGSSATARPAAAPSGRLVDGVAAGIAARLGISPWIVRVAFVVLAFVGGAGIILYAALWVARGDPAGTAGPLAGVFRLVAIVTVAAGALLAVDAIAPFDAEVAWPALLVAVGIAVIWQHVQPREQEWWRRIAGSAPGGALGAALGGPGAAVRLILGVVLLGLGIAGTLAALDALAAAQEVVVAVAATAIGLALIFAPWIIRLARGFAEERTERIRAQEREEMAARIHDSTLQTLALIQRSAGDAPTTARLARRGERELRGWLFPATAGEEESVRGAVERMAADVEDLHDVSVEAVCVGDADVAEPLQALLAAVREATVNAAKFAGVDAVRVYVEVEEGRASAYVRDEGVGFDPDAVPADRHGIRDSIVARLRRFGGDARVRSAPGEGTEVEMEVSWLV